MSTNTLISICIPTYNRTDLLLQTVESCLKQSYKNIEIVIGDDSTNGQTEAAVRQLNRPDVIRYYLNRPSLGQNENVNRLFSLARGKRLMLLHDDDLLMPTALGQMDTCWQKNPFIVACFGKQYLIDMSGKVLRKESEELNQHYRRISQLVGLQASTTWSALVGQFPNNAYLVLTEAAQKVGYRSKEEVGDACDFDFGLRLAMLYGNFWFLDEYTAAYRLSDVSVTKSQANDAPYQVYRIIKHLQVPHYLEAARKAEINSLSQAVVSNMLQKRLKKEAQKLYFSSDYPLFKKTSLKGLWQMFQVICPEDMERRLAMMVRKAKATA